MGSYCVAAVSQQLQGQSGNESIYAVPAMMFAHTLHRFEPAYCRAVGCQYTRCLGKLQLATIDPTARFQVRLGHEGTDRYQTLKSRGIRYGKQGSMVLIMLASKDADCFAQSRSAQCYLQPDGVSEAAYPGWMWHSDPSTWRRVCVSRKVVPDCYDIYPILGW